MDGLARGLPATPNLFGGYKLVQYKSAASVNVTLDALPTPGNILLVAGASDQQSGASFTGGGCDVIRNMVSVTGSGNNRCLGMGVGLVGASPAALVTATWTGNGATYVVELAPGSKHIPRLLYAPAAVSATANTATLGALSAPFEFGGLVFVAWMGRAASVTGPTMAADRLTVFPLQQFGASNTGRLAVGFREHDIDPSPGFTVTSGGTTGIIAGQCLIV